MLKFNSRISKKLLLLSLLILICACSSRRVYRVGPNPPTNQTRHIYPESRIVSRGILTNVQMTRYFLSKNPNAKAQSVDFIARVYIREAMAEGINHDIAFAQMCHETNFLRYGNQVKSWQHNYCGLGATDDGSKGLSFPDVQTGVRAHIQHLKAYGSRYPLKNRLVDPRFKYVKRGSAPTIDHLAGTWASDRKYAAHLRKHLAGMLGSFS